MIDQFKRYQVGLTLDFLFPKIDGRCACGCGRVLPKSRKKWATDNCRNDSFEKFAIVKGDVSIIRKHLYLRDLGRCAHCGIVSIEWEADHINSVSAGGGGCGLENFQTLCLLCHKAKTYNLSHHIAISSQAISIRANRCL